MARSIVYRTKPEEMFTVWGVFYNLIPSGNIRTNRDGRKFEKKTKILSHNGRHTICRNYGNVRENNTVLDDLIVDKMIDTGTEYRLYLRKEKKLLRATARGGERRKL